MRCTKLAMILVLTAAAWIAGCEAPGGDSGYRAKRFRSLEPATWADLERGERIAGISLESYTFAPTKEQLDAEWQAHRIRSSFQEYTRGVYVELSGLWKGEFEDLRLEYAGVNDPVVCAIVTPRWGDIHGVAARCARFGLELGELAFVSLDVGALVRTSRENWYAVLRPTEGAGCELASIAVVLQPTLLPSLRRWCTPDAIEGVVREAAGHGDTDLSGAWTNMLREARSCGIAGVEPILAALESETREMLGPPLSEIERDFDGATARQQLYLLSWLSNASREAVLKSGSLPADVHGILVRRAKQVLERVSVDAAADRSRGRLIAAGVGDAILAALARRVSIERLSANDWSSFNSITRCASLGSWLLEQAEQASAGSLDDTPLQTRQVAIAAAGYAHPDDRSREVLDEYVLAFREAVASAYAAAAAEAEERELFATAAGRYLTAHALRSDVTYRMQADLEGERARLLGPEAKSADADALELARRAGLRLAARVLPFVEVEPELREALRPSLDGNGLLAGLPFTDNRRLGLEIGTCDRQRAFATAVGAPLFALRPSRARVTSVESATSRTNGTKILTDERVVSNDQEYLAWQMAVDEVLVRMHAAEERFDRLRAQSMIVRQMRPWDRIGAFTGDSGVSEWRIETLESALDRLADAESAKAAGDEMERLYAEYERVWAEQPARSTVKRESRVVEYPIEVQTWSLGLERDVALVRGEERHVHTGSATLALECLRIAANPSIGVAACDQWRDEESARAEAVRDEHSLAEYLRFGLRSELEDRLRGYALSLEDRALGDDERMTERIWMSYLFKLDWVDELASEIPPIVALGHACAR